MTESSNREPAPAGSAQRSEAESEVREVPPRRGRLTTREASLLEARRRASRKRPRFKRDESWRYVRVGDSWRRPRGGSSKRRKRMKGWPAVVRVGYRGPRAVRGLSPSGFKEALVHSEDELDGLDPKREAARIGHAVGAKKRASMREKARSLQLRIVNPGPAERVEAAAPTETKEPES